MTEVVGPAKGHSGPVRHRTAPSPVRVFIPEVPGDVLGGAYARLSIFLSNPEVAGLQCSTPWLLTGIIGNANLL